VRHPFLRIALSLLASTSSIAILFLGPGGHPIRAQAQIQKQKGFSYATWWSGEYSNPNADQAVAKLAETGTDWISLIVTQYQDTISSTSIYSTTATPTDADLIHAITYAHSLGMKVMLKPHVDLANDPAHWRGEIGQGFTSSKWTAWFTSYNAFINHYAQLAQANSVEQFCIGTELSATEAHTTNWRAVASGVRGIYTGPLTYAANWGSETSLSWWDAVDFIGVDAYYPLTDKNDPTVAELNAAWLPHVTTLASLASTWNKSILFTEIGYRSQDGANQHPWDWQLDGTLDFQEQADTYQAAFQSVFNQPWFAGFYWWSWETDPFQGGPCDDGYTPYDKPAEAVLRAWYGASPKAIHPPPQPDYSKVMNVYTDSLSSSWEDWSWSATVNFSANSPVYSGAHAIAVAAQPWGALSLFHPDFDSTPYYWLEFYVRESSAQQGLRSYFSDKDDNDLRPLGFCRYAETPPIVQDVWTRIRIPLLDLNASNRSLQGLSIMNYQDQASSFWLDQIRLVGAAWNGYLPLVLQNP
jgi:hypothetical protein